MKLIMTSDSHKNRENMAIVRDFAKENGIETIVDCGDLHGEIDAFEGVNLHAVFWEEASGGMKRGDFRRDMSRIDGTVHEDGSAFVLGNAAFYLQHDFVGKEKMVPEKAWARAIERLEDFDQEKKFVGFGHTHQSHYDTRDGVAAINPGGLGHSHVFVVLDTETGEVEFRDLDKVILKVGKEFEHVRGLYESKGQVQFIARVPSGKEVAVVDGTMSQEHKKVRSIRGIKEGVPTYTAVQDNGSVVLVEAGKVGKEYKDILCTFESYEEGFNFIGIGSYIASTGEGRQVLVLEDRTETREFHKIKKDKPMVLDGKLCFVANKEEDGNEFVIHGDDEILEYKEIKKMEDLDGKLLVVAETEDEKMVLNYNGVESRRYDSIQLSDGKRFGDDLAFTAKEGDEEFVVVGDKEEEHFKKGDWQDGISKLRDVAGKPAYIVKTGGKEFVCHGDYRSPEVKAAKWDNLHSRLSEIDGKLGFILKDGDNSKVFVDGECIREGKQIQAFRRLDNGMMAFSITTEDYKDLVECNGKQFEYSTLDEFECALKDGEVKLD